MRELSLSVPLTHQGGGSGPHAWRIVHFTPIQPVVDRHEQFPGGRYGGFLAVLLSLQPVIEPTQVWIFDGVDRAMYGLDQQLPDLARSVLRNSAFESGVARLSHHRVQSHVSNDLFGSFEPVDLAEISASPVLIAVIFVFGLTVSGGLNEEPGWRGFAQPYLNDRYSALMASLIIGVVWAGWHLPYFLIPITPHSGFTIVNQLGWVLGILLLSIILAWAYNNTGSVLVVMVLHAMVNTADILLPLAPEQIVMDGIINEPAVATVTMTQLAVQLLVVLLIIGYFGQNLLAHGETPGVAHIRGGN